MSGFPTKPNKKFGSFDKPVYCVIWTTTPWTLPANLAIALHENHEYGFFENENEFLLIAREIREKFENETNLKLKSPKKFFLGKNFEFEQAEHPFENRSSLLILSEYVNLESGSGLVHTAPGHGQEDHQVASRYKLPVISPVGPNGCFTDEAPKYRGLHVFKANPVIIEDLKTSRHLLAQKNITHSYPHCWRTKTPLIFRNTSQWFIKMDDESYNIRQKALTAIDSIDFVPKWGIKRLKAMVENRPDWCISRQRNWGVPLPVLHCKDCGHPWLDEKVMEKIAVVMEEGSGIESYDQLPIDKLVQNHSCEKCGSKNFKKSPDILDVWFDSGVCHSAVQRKEEGLKFPADLYLEGSDQHRGWFQTSLLTSVASTGQSPFKSLLTHNFVNDSQGRKMSKSLGNVVDPKDLIKKSGAELLRLWTASQDYGQDINFSEQSFQRVTETYRRLRNSLKFLLGNLSDFDIERDQILYKNLTPLDQWILDRFYQFMESVTQSYNHFEFYKVYQSLNQFFTIDLSNHYLDMIKDRLYTWKTRGPGRRASQTVLYFLTDGLIRVMAPITSFLSEEAYSVFHQSPNPEIQFSKASPLEKSDPHEKKEEVKTESDALGKIDAFSKKAKESVFLESFPRAKPQWKNQRIRELFEVLFEVRSIASKKIEEQRTEKKIRSSLEVSLCLKLTEKEMKVFENLSQIQLREFFIVSQVVLSPNKTEKTVGVLAQKAQGEKCPRCWNYGILKEVLPYGRLCEKCCESIKRNKEK